MSIYEAAVGIVSLRMKLPLVVS